MGKLVKSNLFDPRTCTYKLSGVIRSHVERLIDAKETDPEVKSILVSIMEEDETNKNTLTYESIVTLHKYIQRADEDYLDPFYIFVDSCKCIEPKPRQNKQLDERLKNLRLRNSQAIYNEMTVSVDRNVEEKLKRLADGCETADLTSGRSPSGSVEGQSITSEFKRLNGSVVAVFNSFLVFICTFIFCYKALEYALHQPNIIAQVLFGLAGSTVVAIAELYFLMRVV